MATTPTTPVAPHRPRPRPEWWWDAGIRKALPAPDPGRLTCSAVLTMPEEDLDGDIVIPKGMAWDGPVPVDIDHRPVYVAECHPELMSVPWKGRRVETVVGHLRFDKADGRSRQAFDLVRRDVVLGVSAEFLPVAAKSLGYESLLNPSRQATLFEQTRLTGLALCVHCPPKNEWAGIMPDSIGKAVAAGHADILRAGRLASEPLDPVIRKAIAVVTVPHGVPRSVKAMDYSDPTGAPVDSAPALDPPADGPMPDDADSDTPPTAKAAYDAAQAASDMAAQIRDAVGRSEHLKGKAKLLALADKLDSLAEDASAVGDMVMSDVGGEDEGDEPEEADDDSADDDSDAEMTPEERAEKALLRDELAFRRKYVKALTKTATGLIQTKSGYRGKRLPPRFLLADARPAGTAGPADDDEMTPAELARLESIERRRRRLKAASAHRATR